MLKQSAAAFILASSPVVAFDLPEDEAARQFVTSNVIATFYHEFGHALIDVLQLPVLGKEEDAADTLSALLTHHIWEEDAATQIVYDTAFAYWAYAAESEKEGWDLPFADTHSLDLQRYYSLVCLYYGANPDVREDEAKELDLPEERAALCEEEFELADESWGALLDGLTPGEGTSGLRLAATEPGYEPLASILSEEIKALNETYGLPTEVAVRIESCGEANAFYYPDETSITICTEYPEELARLYAETE